MVIRMREIRERIQRDMKDFWLAALVIVGYGAAVNLIFGAFCPMVILTGFPCPGCGMSRSIFYLFTGRLQQSVFMHPLGLPIVCIIVYFLWNRYIRGRRAKGIVFLIGVSAVFLVVFYIWRMVLYFPHRAPYVYTEQNILADLCPFYEQILHEWGII